MSPAKQPLELLSGPGSASEQFEDGRSSSNQPPIGKPSIFNLRQRRTSLFPDIPWMSGFFFGYSLDEYAQSPY